MKYRTVYRSIYGVDLWSFIKTSSCLLIYIFIEISVTQDDFALLLKLVFFIRNFYVLFLKLTRNIQKSNQWPLAF